ncbi:OstA-like protein [Urechidicola sp. KH5]
MKHLFLVILLTICSIGFSQNKSKINILNYDVTQQSEENPEATIAYGNVVIEINGATIKCDKAEIYFKKNYLKALGKVIMNQGDTVILTSKFADYNGETQMARAWENVLLKDPSMTLNTERLFFDRANQHLFYKEHGTIKDSINVLKSKIGNYFLENKKFQAKSKVVVTNPDHVLESNYLDYFTNSAQAYVYGPSTITSETSVVYTEKGYSDTKNKISHLTKNSWIQYDDRLIEGDSLFHNGVTSFSSATGNIKITDTINDSTLKGGYAEVFKLKDSAFVIDRAQVISLMEQDSLYIHGDTLMVTGKPEERLIRAYHHVKIFKSDLQGKCDSLSSYEVSGVTKMFRKPVLWSNESQITGDVIHFLSNKETSQLDSLKVLGNAFMVQEDSIGFNQTKGRDIFGKFIENDLKIVDVQGNGQVIHYVRNEENELLGISKVRCSNIYVTLNDSKLETISFLVQPEGKTYPEEELHVNDRKLKGLEWRIAERPMTKEAIFIVDPGDAEMRRLALIEEREARIQAAKEAEEAEERRKAAELLQKQQDSLAQAGALNKELNPKAKQSSNNKTPSKEKRKKEKARNEE